MRVLWISCLLIGRITCSRVYKGFGSYNAIPPATHFMPQQSFSTAEGNYEFDIGNTGLKDNGYGSPEASVNGGPYAEYGAYASAYEAADISAEVGGGNDGSPSGYVDSSYLSVAEGTDGGFQEDGTFGYGVSGETSEESLEPVFSDVSDLDPVYSFSSRSHYQRGKRIFTQTRYTPNIQLPVMPLSSALHSQSASVPRKSVTAPTKGGFR